jgi:hypothetical protein
MRRTRARLLAAAVVISSAGVASASLDLVVSGPGPRGPAGAAGSDGGITIDDTIVVAGSDAPMEGGFDAIVAGSDAPMEGGIDALPDAGSDAPTATIDIVETTIAISGPQGSTAMATANVITPDFGQLGSASIASSDPSFKLSYCGLSTCAWPPQPLPYALTVECVPGSGQTTATLTVFEASGSSTDFATVTCTSTSSGPVLDVMPASLNFQTLPVGQTASQMIQISNTGFGLLDNVVIDFGATPNASQWQASACTAASPCQLSGGASTFVSITFAPTTHGVKDVTLTVTSNGGTDTVSLFGTGTGGVMSVKTPPGPSYVLDIGTIPRGQAFSRDIVLENLGNAPYTATTTPANAPYTIAAGSFPVAAGATTPITVTCQSATATPTDNPQTITISSDAYQGSPASVDVRCKIADTTLQIMPTMFDFGEVRVGTPEPSIDITLTNPATSAAAAQITAFDLRKHTAGLTLTKPAVPFSVAVGATQLATLKLSTTADTDLAGEYLDITVDGTQLQFPVSGKVVTPHSRVVPANQLDLGTACVGTDVTGNVMLINDGTATLSVQAPEMDQSFLAAAPGAPGTLAAGKSLTAMVTPSSAAMGSITGNLTWRDDVPSEHQIGVLLDYVSSGTALSPRGLDFGVVPVGFDVGPQHIKLQNCDLAPTKIKIVSLKTKSGTLGAWIVEPRVGYEKQLAAKEEQAVTVTFDPPARGHYEADLTVQTAQGKQVVHLVGDASGRDFDNTSFYACACNGPGAPTGGVPIVAAVIIVIGRRRRGSSSAR